MIDWKFLVTLGPVDRSHLPILRSWRNDPRIWDWCRQSDLISDWDQEKWFERQSQDPTIKMYTVHDSNGSVCGVAGLTDIHPINRRAEFSLYIAPAFQRKGLGEKALKTLFSHGFYTLNLNLIWGECMDGNPACQLFEKIGMLKEGTQREFYFKKGKWLDAHRYSIRAIDWRDQWTIS